ncbi:MAG: hypothetical protein ABIO02_03760 [Patescibacteria group bacterium]
MITEKDMQLIEDRLRKVFVTKTYFEYRLDKVESELKEFKEEMYKFKDSVLKSLDWLVGAFQKFDEEYTVAHVQYKRVTETLEDHDNRITICEDRLQLKR